MTTTSTASAQRIGSTTLRRLITQSATLQNFLARARTENRLTISGVAGSAQALLIGALWEALQRTVLVILPFEKMAAALHSDLEELYGEENVALFPSWGVYPYEWLIPPVENAAQRLETLWKLQRGVPLVVVTSPDGLREPTMSIPELLRCCFTLRTGEEYDLETLAGRLAAIGYERLPITEEVGTFSIRGGILDLFPFTCSDPVRCEFFGDTLESMRSFSVLTQRSIEEIDRVDVIPRREVVVSGDQLERKVERLPTLSRELVQQKCLSGIDYPGLEWLSPLLQLDTGNLLDHLPPQTLSYLFDADQVSERLGHLEMEADRVVYELRQYFPDVPMPQTLFLSEERLQERLKQSKLISELPLGTGDINFGMQEHPAFDGQVSLLRTQLDEWLKHGKSVFLLSDNELQSERLQELLGEYSDRVYFVVCGLQRGFALPEIDTVVLTDHQIFERQVIRRRRRRFKEGQAISSYHALEYGDFVVHIDHGIGRYRGLKEIRVNQRRHECLLIEYAEGDKLYVPIEEFSRIQKFVGKEGAPQLTRLGGKSWEKIKARTRKAIAEMAEALIALYAARKARPGFAFPEDDEWMRELGASFPYEETPDQLRAIGEVKKDMIQPVPMDRLICGDVGFGKTEVAIRAALKAVSAGKQVAVLVPTTILAQQHLTTFGKRLNPFPVRVEMLSRFLSRNEQKQVIADLAEGKVDIVIGTHRLLQKDLQIPNLGLIVIDEEQRFGVAHKEKLKHLKKLADCLTLTATPIPRTLQMSLLGARDMSLIGTSPKERQAIVTEIAEFDPKILYEAITQEVSRKGQVYFVHNRVETIESVHRYLTKLLRHIRITVAHGQMPEKELEQVMLGFLNREYDVLLCSAIIESGIDIPTVNTIIINRADRFGLAQLYQLRGRVGRSQQRAYAFLLVPPFKQLTDNARKRLKAIEQHTELGSGFHLAMKDLEIRGAGNLLGPQQHGFIEEVGFDLYCRLLEEAVAELKGEPVPEEIEVRLEVDSDCYLPESYVEDSRQRVEVYRRVAEARSIEELEAFGAELVDRFGRYGAETENLLNLMAMNLLAKRKKIAQIKVDGRKLQFTYVNGQLPSKETIARLRNGTEETLSFDSSDKFTVRVELSDAADNPLAEAKRHLALL